jgi:serine/threonine protein kinase
MGTQAWKCPTVTQDNRWTAFADLWALAVTFYEALTGAPLFQSSGRFDVELDRDCVKGFPQVTFEKIKAIIQGNVDHETPVEQYHELFGTSEGPAVLNEIPSELAERFSITSKRQTFLTLAMLNHHKMDQLRSKSVIIREALYASNQPAGQDAMRRYRAVFSQLKSTGVVEYGGKANKKAMLTQTFRTQLAELTGN